MYSVQKIDKTKQKHMTCVLGRNPLWTALLDIFQVYLLRIFLLKRLKGQKWGSDCKTYSQQKQIFFMGSVKDSEKQWQLASPQQISFERLAHDSNTFIKFFWHLYTASRRNRGTLPRSHKRVPESESELIFPDFKSKRVLIFKLNSVPMVRLHHYSG